MIERVLRGRGGPGAPRRRRPAGRAALVAEVRGRGPIAVPAALVAIGLTAVVCALGLSAWWLAPLVALGALRWTLRGARPSATSASKTSS
jgi:hypothetical protein